MKRFFLAVLVALAAACAQAGVNIEHWVTPSGARAYFVETHVLPIVDIQVDFSAGAAYDPAEKSGLAGITRGMLEAGAADLDEEKLADRLADIGARLGGSADLDRAGVSLRTLATKRERDAAIDLMQSVLQRPLFPQAVLEREKSRAIAGIRESDTRPASIASRRFSTILYGAHPYGATPSAESVASIERDDLVAFHRSHYGATRAVFSIIGDLSRSEAEAIAARLSDGLPPAQADAGLPEVTLPLRSTVRVAHPATQAHVLLGLPGIRRGDPDFFPLLVGNYILGGGGFASRLMQEVREKRGYAYNVYSHFQPLLSPGPFQIGLQTKRENVSEAIKVVETTLDAFLRKGPTEKEVRAAKTNLAEGFALRLDSNRKILDYLSLIGFYGLPLSYLDDFARNVKAVTASGIRSAFERRVRPEHIVTVIVAGE